jgi:MFS family permease
MAFTFIPVSIAALAGVPPDKAGLASGLMNTSQQIGGAVGVAIAATIFTSHAKTLLASGDTPASAFTAGYQHAFWALVGLALLGAFSGALLLRREKLPVEATANVPVA